MKVEKLSREELLVLLQEKTAEQEHLEYMLESINGVSWDFDLQTNRFTYVSKNIKTLFGYEHTDWVDYQSWADTIHEDDREKTTAYCEIETKKGRNHIMEYRLLKKSGDVVWVLDVITLIKDQDDNPVRLFGSIIDIDKQKRAQIELENEHSYIESILENIADPVVVTRADFSIDLMNEKAKKRLKNIKVQDPKSPKCYELFHQRSTPCDTRDHVCPLRETLKNKVPTTVIHKHIQEDKTYKYVELAVTPLFDKEQNCTGVIESIRDVSNHLNLVDELKEKSEVLEYKAHHDALTGLPNRVLFHDRLNQAILSAKRDKLQLALLFIDLDYFKEVNDRLGHSIGDELLKEVALRVRDLLREKDTLSRLGGDEFTVIVEGVKSAEDVEKLATKILDSFSESFIVQHHQISISCSIGISLYPNEKDSAYELINAADMAMYKAKGKGKNDFALYTEE